MDPDPLPLLLGDNIADAAVPHPGGPEHRIPVLKEVLQGGSWGGDAKEAAHTRTAELIDPDVCDALFVEGSVDQGDDVLGFRAVQLAILVREGRVGVPLSFWASKGRRV